MGSLTQLVDCKSQTSLVPISVLPVDEVLGRGLVKKAMGHLEFLHGFFLVALGTHIFESCAHAGTESTVPNSVNLSSFHPLRAGFMIRQCNVLSIFVNKLAF